MLEERVYEVCVWVDDDDGVVVCAVGLLVHLVGDDVVHEGGFSHASACDVEVVSFEEVVWEVDVSWSSCCGVVCVSDVGA